MMMVSQGNAGARSAKESFARVKARKGSAEGISNVSKADKKRSPGDVRRARLLNLDNIFIY